MSDISLLFDKAEVSGKDLNVYCISINNHRQLTNAVTPVALATIPKVLSVKRIVFYTTGEKIISKPVELTSNSESVIKQSNTTDAKPVVLKRTMRKPAVI